MNHVNLVEEIEKRAASLSVLNVPALRLLRREFSRRLASESPGDVVKIAALLIKRSRVHRFVGDELIAARPDAIATLGLKEIEELGSSISTWDQVDCFACYLSGPAWREGQITDAAIVAWSNSTNRWWRRAALVSTVPLNLKARGGTGDTLRTLKICKLLMDDRDDMVVKALSWALRALACVDSAAVQQFVEKNKGSLAPRVIREVQSKLTTGRKNPRRD